MVETKYFTSQQDPFTMGMSARHPHFFFREKRDVRQ